MMQEAICSACNNQIGVYDRCFVVGIYPLKLERLK